jgi:hypothetical protein
MLIMQLRRIIGYLQKLLYTVKRMSLTSTLNIYLFEGPIGITGAALFGHVLWVAFSIPSGSLSFVKYPA